MAAYFLSVTALGQHGSFSRIVQNSTERGREKVKNFKGPPKIVIMGKFGGSADTIIAFPVVRKPGEVNFRIFG
jgi:hypothetical protein